MCSNPKDLNPDTVQSIEIIKKLYGDSNCQAIFYDLQHKEKVDFSATNLKSIEIFKGLPELKILLLTKNNIENLSPISSLKQLQELQLGYNNIQDVTPLLNLNKLEKLDLAGNNIKDPSKLASLVNLTYLNLRRNPTKNAKALERKGLILYYDDNYQSPKFKPGKITTIPFQTPDNSTKE